VEEGLPGKAIQWGPIGEVGAWHDGYNAEYQRISFLGAGVQSIGSVLRALDPLLSHSSPVTLSKRLVDIADGSLTSVAHLTVMERVAHVLGKANNVKLNPNAKLTELGMDSLMAMEIKQILETDFNLSLSATEIRTCTLAQLQEMSKNSSNTKIVAVTAPKAKGATAAMFQLNFIRGMTRTRMMHDTCVHPINDLARERVIVEGEEPKGSVFIINSAETPDVLHLLGSYCKLPAYSMQWPHHIATDDILELTQFYYEVRRQNINTAYRNLKCEET
jgi:fatty acid synthase